MKINEPDALVDAVIVGGGPAGWSAAIYLARARRSVLVFDCDRTGRSDWGQVNHNLLGFPDGIRLTDLMQRGRTQADRFGVRCIEEEVASIVREADVFLSSSPNHAIRSRTVILATGVEDSWVDFPGYKTFVGRTMHWCIVCDGYEMIGQRVVIAGNDDGAAEMALQMCIYTPDVTLVTHAGSLALPPETVADLEARGVTIAVGRIESATASAPGIFATITLDTGETIALDHLFSVQGAVPNTAIAQSLGVALADNGYIIVDTEAKTNIPGLYAAGDVTRALSHQVGTAIHEGSAAALSAAYHLYQADRSAAPPPAPIS